MEEILHQSDMDGTYPFYSIKLFDVCFAFLAGV